MKNLSLLFALLFGGTMWLAAQSQKVPPCSAPAYRQFDFWIGEWDVFVNDELVGTNKIEPILDGCTLLENWVSTKQSKGHSFNSYNRGTKQWEQTWVDNFGSIIHFYGTYADRKMSFTAEDLDLKGEKVYYRFTFFNNENGTVRQLWESSSDKTEWRIVFDGLYKKRI